MTTHTLAQAARTSSLLDLGTLASATYITSSAIDLGATIPLFFVLQAECDPNGTPSGNKQLVLFLKWSLDNTNYTSGPESGTTATEEADLHFIGSLPCNDTNVHRKEFIVYPKGRYCKIVAKNDMGVALTSGNIYRSDFSGESA
jgi:hypothetical protein